MDPWKTSMAVVAVVVVVAVLFVLSRDDPGGSSPSSLTDSAWLPLASRPAAEATQQSTAVGDRPSSPDATSQRWAQDEVAKRRKLWEGRRDAIRKARKQRLQDTAPDQESRRSQGAEKGRMDPQTIRDEMRSLFPLLRECYENARLDAGALQGKLVLRYVIAGEESVGGIIEEVEIDQERSDQAMRDNPSLAQCVTETVYTMEFEAPPRGGGIVTVAYPIRFTPQRRRRAA